jgi:hypothetical protein
MTMRLEASSDKAAMDLQSTSEESGDDSQFTAKYEAQMRTLGHALRNWQFEKCYLSNSPVMRCQFKNSCNNFVHKKCSILWYRTHGQNVQDIESVGRAESTTWTTTKKFAKSDQLWN